MLPVRMPKWRRMNRKIEGATVSAFLFAAAMAQRWDRGGRSASRRAGGVARRELGGGDEAWGEDGNGRGRGAVAFFYRQRSQGRREGDSAMT